MVKCIPVKPSQRRLTTGNAPKIPPRYPRGDFYAHKQLDMVILPNDDRGLSYMRGRRDIFLHKTLEKSFQI